MVKTVSQGKIREKGGTGYIPMMRIEKFFEIQQRKEV